VPWHNWREGGAAWERFPLLLVSFFSVYRRASILCTLKGEIVGLFITPWWFAPSGIGA
jgi:hypothetical protein